MCEGGHRTGAADRVALWSRWIVEGRSRSRVACRSRLVGSSSECGVSVVVIISVREESEGSVLEGSSKNSGMDYRTVKAEGDVSAGEDV